MYDNHCLLGKLQGQHGGSVMQDNLGHRGWQRDDSSPVSLIPQAYELRNAGAVIHSHSLNAVMATILDPAASEFKVTHLEMIKVRQGFNSFQFTNSVGFVDRSGGRSYDN